MDEASQAWNLRYAGHLSYRTPNAPLFPHSADSIAPVDQVEFCASIGFSGVLYAYAITAPDAEIDAVAQACSRHGLEVGTILFAPHEIMRGPLWGRRDAATRAAIDRYLDRALSVAARLKSRHIAVLSGCESDVSRDEQQDAMVENLRRVADRVANAGAALELEGTSRERLPGMLLHGMAETLSVLEKVNHPAVRLIFDTGHVHDNDGDVVGWLKKSRDRLGLVQIADQPGRVEPGAGEIDIPGILAELMRHGFSDLVEMEHGWVEPDRKSEQAGIARLRQMDRMAHAQISAERSTGAIL